MFNIAGKKFFSFLTAGALALCVGCKDIEYPEFIAEPAKTTPPIITDINNQESPNMAQTSEYPVSVPELGSAEFSKIMEAETEKNVLSSLDGYYGNGYVCLDAGDFRTFKINIPESQHYKVTIRVCSQSAKLKLLVGGSQLVTDRIDGTKTVDGVIHGIYNISEAVYFQEFSLDGVYLDKGQGRITIQSAAGTAYLDRITVETGKKPSNNLYEISSLPIDKEADGKTISLMSYIKSIYGKNTLTAQYVTPNTNTEAEAIYMAAKRFPALRCADLYPYSRANPEYGLSENHDLQLAAEWWDSGGLVSYSWSWYAPVSENSHYYAERTDFDVRRVFSNSTDVNLAELDTDTLEQLYGSGAITDEAFNLIKDIDSMAQNLKWLQDNGVVVLFRPLMEAGSRRYWWDRDRDAYISLWKLLVQRLNGYNKLHNLIWVWTGDKYDYYPGDEYVDIIGVSLYNHMPGSGCLQFSDAAKFSIKPKAIAMSETCILPNPDVLFRDNAKWLWTSVWRGDYIINPDGSLNNMWTSRQSLVYAYNHEFYITRDELPAF